MDKEKISSELQTLWFAIRDKAQTVCHGEHTSYRLYGEQIPYDDFRRMKHEIVLCGGANLLRGYKDGNHFIECVEYDNIRVTLDEHFLKEDESKDILIYDIFA